MEERTSLIYCERALAIQHTAHMKVQAAEGRGNSISLRELEQYYKWLHPAGSIDQTGNIVWSAQTQMELRGIELKTYIQRSIGTRLQRNPPQRYSPHTNVGDFREWLRSVHRLRCG